MSKPQKYRVKQTPQAEEKKLEREIKTLETVAEQSSQKQRNRNQNPLRKGEQLIHRTKMREGNIMQPTTSKEVITAWDAMLAAKQHPGEFNTPFVAGMNLVPFPTLIAKTNTTEFQADDFGENFLPLGTKDYTVIAFCPVLTLLYGSGGNDDFDENTKLGGLIMVQTDDLNSTSTLYPDQFNQVFAGRSMASVFGSDMTGFCERGFIWSSQLDVNLIAAAANITGTYYQGTLTMGQIQHTTSDNGLSVHDLIQIAGKAKNLEGGARMKSAIVNHNLVYDNGSQEQEIGAGGFTTANWSAELISYIVFQTPAKNITNGQNSQFTLQFHVQSNGVFVPNPFDALANNLFRQTQMPPGVTSSPLPGVLAGRSYHPDNSAPKGRGLVDTVKKMIHGAWENRDSIMQTAYKVAEHVAPLLLASGPGLTKGPDQPTYGDVASMRKHLTDGLMITKVLRTIVSPEESEVNERQYRRGLRFLATLDVPVYQLDLLREAMLGQPQAMKTAMLSPRGTLSTR